MPIFQGFLLQRVWLILRRNPLWMFSDTSDPGWDFQTGCWQIYLILILSPVGFGFLPILCHTKQWRALFSQFFCFRIIGSPLQHAGFSSFGMRSWLPHCVRIFVPQPGFEPKSPALQGIFLTTGLPGKSWNTVTLKREASNEISECTHLLLIHLLCAVLPYASFYWLS